jgi:hypothetical protein
VRYDDKGIKALAQFVTPAFEFVREGQSPY